MHKKIFQLRILGALIALVISNVLYSQDLPDVIPPSPEAASILSSGNTGVNFYAGQPSFSIPIHTISVRGYSFPISISYSSFQGINVESVAPWVGLGWSLNASGTISRTIRGKADDDQVNGYLQLSEPDLEDPNEVLEFGTGYRDGEPDKFFYSVNGLSGTFYFKKDSVNGIQIIQKTKSNVRIEYVSGTPIPSFTITDTNGIQYFFSEQEVSETVPQGGSRQDVPDNVTTWYLTSIIDQKGEDLISYTYYSFNNLEYTTFAPNSSKEGTIPFNSVSDMSTSTHYLKGKRIKEIIFPSGKVEFTASSSTRLDYPNDKYLTDIRVFALDATGYNQIKKYQFYFSYFDPDALSGVVPIDAAPSNVLFESRNVGDYKRRLKLDSVQQTNGLESIPPYRFEYNLDYDIPHRFSLATDHWGFSNGKTGNTSPEPYHRFKYYIAVDNTPRFGQFGSADKSPNAAYAKSGVLQKVIYPTGGSTQFEFEGNTAADDRLPNDFNFVQINVPVNDSLVNFTVDMLNQPFVPLNINGLVSQDKTNCTIYGSITDQSNSSIISTFTINPSGEPLSSHDKEVILENEGSYAMQLDFATGCPGVFQPNDQLLLTYQNEIQTDEKNVGGLRVKSITDHDGISTANDVIRNFSYNSEGETGMATGRVVNVPKYAFQAVVRDALNIFQAGVTRTISSRFPLSNTQGSFVGYGKVTVSMHDGTEMGKTEYEFTTAEEFPDFVDAYYETPLSGDAFFFLGGKGSEEIVPLAKVDERDFMRGLLKRKTDYAYENGSFTKISEVINEYAFTHSLPNSNGEGVSIAPNWNSFFDASANQTNSYAKGLSVVAFGQNTYTKFYNIYAGRIDKRKSIERQYSQESATRSLEKSTTSYWDNLSSGYYQVTRTEFVDSGGDVLKTRVFYPYEKDSLSGLSTIEENSLDSMAVKNMINNVAQQEQFRNGVKLSTSRTNFKEFNGYYLPSSIEISKDTNSLEERLIYHSYDSNGNVQEVSKESGVHITYLWGYSNTYPVAEIRNATYAQVKGILSQGADLDLGNAGLTQTQEDSLRMQLGDAFITTMTYKVGVGIKTKKDPNGRKMEYFYDDLNRLYLVKDHDGNILSKSEYNYKTDQ